MTLTSVKDCDFLDQDPPLRNQNYVCLSFISPEDVIKKKETYMFENFVKGFSDDMKEFFVHMKEKYPAESDMLQNIQERYSYVFDTEKIQEEFQFYLSTKGSHLEEEYFQKNDFQTTIRGIKVRGVFDTLREAEIRAQVLKKIDDKFHVYVAQVGCWCPWSPNPDDISNQEYAETHLNTMVRQYKENQEKRDLFYQERKRDMQFAKVEKNLEQSDPWTERREEVSVAEVADASVEGVASEAVAAVALEEPVVEDPVPTENVVVSSDP